MLNIGQKYRPELNETSGVERITMKTTPALRLIQFFFLCGMLGTAYASPIGGLYNTGVTDSGQPLSVGSTDAHYAFAVINGTAVAPPNGHPFVGAGTTIQIDGNALPNFPFQYWMPNTSISQWITPSTNAGQSYDPTSTGWYVYTLTFNLNGYDPSTASFVAQWAADQGGYICLNSTVITSAGCQNGTQLSSNGIPLNLSNYAPFNSWTPFSATTGFQAGLNTLSFYIGNPPQTTNNPIGLNVEFLGSDVARVPEPGTAPMFAFALIILTFALRISRRNQNHRFSGAM